MKTNAAAQSTDQIWSTIFAERAALAADVAGVTDERWETESLCAGLSVREVLAHMTVAGSLTPLRWMAGVIRCRFDFDRQVAMRLAQYLGNSSSDTLAIFRGIATSKTSPPLPKLALLGEVVVHSTDIRHPLGLVREHPATALVPLAQYYAGSNQMLPSKKRIDGLQLVANDTEFTIGSGPMVTGPTLALIMAMTGRTAFHQQLSGPGLDTLESRR